MGKKGYFPDGVNSLSTDDGQDKALLYDNTAAMMLHGSWQVSGIRADNQEWYDENIGVFRFLRIRKQLQKGFPRMLKSERRSVTASPSTAGTLTVPWIRQSWMPVMCLRHSIITMMPITRDSDSGTIPSIKGFEETIDDPNMKVVADVFFTASNVQLWYDQYLPASVTEVHKDCMTELFGLQKTPEQIGQEQDAAMKAAIAE